jgi:hypothetical protein
MNLLNFSIKTRLPLLILNVKNYFRLLRLTALGLVPLSQKPQEAD